MAIQSREEQIRSSRRFVRKAALAKLLA